MVIRFPRLLVVQAGVLVVLAMKRHVDSTGGLIAYLRLWETKDSTRTASSFCMTSALDRRSCAKACRLNRAERFARLPCGDWERGSPAANSFSTMVPLAP